MIGIDDECVEYLEAMTKNGVVVLYNSYCMSKQYIPDYLLMEFCVRNSFFFFSWYDFHDSFI